MTSLPLSQMYAWGPITVEGRVPPPGEKFINADTRMVSGHYFQAMEIPLIEGRFFNDHDVPANPGVAIVDDYMAQQLWPGQRRGRQAHSHRRHRRHQCAVDHDCWSRRPGKAVHAGLRLAHRFLSSPHAVPGASHERRGAQQHRSRRFGRRGEPAMHELDTDLPLYNVVTMEQRVQLSLARRRFAMLLLAGFAGISLALAAIGIYGVLAYLVSQGTREIGIRMALGATRTAILGLVLRNGIVLALTGVAMGVAAALLLTRLMQSLLFGVTAGDPLTFCAVPLLLLFIALLATSVPARRAAQVDPAECLRYD